MGADGANQTAITNLPGTFSQNPVWSPDGTKIAFARTLSPQTDPPDIYVMNASGSNLIRLTTNPALDNEPAWSPDGTKIAFCSEQNNNDDIYVMNANGSNQVRLTTDPAADDQPAWSPDGGKIAFTSRRNGLKQIFVMDANGANQTSLTPSSGEHENPAWSPDGTKIALNKGGRICVMSAYGGPAIQLTTGARDGHPAWSPDGTKIAFYRGETPDIPIQQDDIFVMNADGSNPIPLTDNGQYEDGPDWQRIAVVPSPTPPAAQALNLSTRMRVQTGDNVGIGGFIITGGAPKHVLLRAIGPSLTQFGIPNALADPAMELHGPGAFVTLTNNNWRENPAQEAAIQATGIPPTDDLESAIDATLAPGAYTAIVSGTGNTSGVALVEAYDLSEAVPGKLANISTRAFVGTGVDVVIAGFILGGNTGTDRIIARGIGPSLSATGVPDALANPTLELRDNNGRLLGFNHDWQDNPAQAAEVFAAGLAPANNLEAAIAATLPPGLYTAILTGTNNGTGVGLVEVYDVGSP
jgi:hypothetical protein